MITKPNVLVCGKTGVGKTSLCQALLGLTKVPNSKIGHSKPKTTCFKQYQSTSISLYDSEGLLPSRSINEHLDFINAFIDKQSRIRNIGKHIHIIWYCIDGSIARIQSAHKKFIRRCQLPIVIAITKNDIISPKQRKAMIGELSLRKINVEKDVIFISNTKKTGIDRLLKRTYKIAPEAMKKSLIRLIRKKEIEFKKHADEQAEGSIFWGTTRAAAIATTPIPLADIAPLVANEAFMISKIGSTYGVSVTENIKEKILALIGASIAGKSIASLLPLVKIPIAAVITFGIGKAAKEYFRGEMKIDEEKLREAYLNAINSSKKFNWKDTVKLSEQKYSLAQTMEQNIPDCCIQCKYLAIENDGVGYCYRDPDNVFSVEELDSCYHLN